MWFEYAQELHTKRKEVWIAEIATVNSKFLNVTGVYINHRTPNQFKTITSPASSRAVRRAAAADNLWAPPPTFVDRRAAADNLSARRQYHCCCVVIFWGIFDDFFFKFSALWQVQTSNDSMFLDVELLL